MLIILLNWIYIFATNYIVGHAVLMLCSKWLHYEGRRRLLTIILTGFAVITTYAGYFSLFAKVSLSANIVLVLLCALLLVIDRRHYLNMPVEIMKYLRKIKCALPRTGTDDATGRGLRTILRMLQFGLGVVIFFVIIFFTCYGVFHSDSGLYHAQSIRWIEEYGIIKGLGLVQNRFGYNSAFFSVSALYSFVFCGPSLHGVNGYMAAFVTIYAYWDIINAVFKRSFGKLHTIVAFAPILYTVIGGMELISPTTDPILLYLVFAIILRWCELLDEGERDVHPYALLCVLTAFLISVKLSVGVLVLLVIEPAIRLIREKKIRAIVTSLISGIVLILPYFIRNVIITGWLIYPFPSIDLFNLPWKLPEGSARHDADEITTWARYVRDASKIDQSVFEWAPVWWKGQTAIDRMFSLAAITAFVIGFIWCAIAIIRLIKNRKAQTDLQLQQMLFLELIVLMGFTFWFFTAPLIRYGYLYLLLTPLLTSAVIGNDTSVYSSLQILIPGILTCMLLYPTGNMLYQDISYMHHNWSRKYAVYQQDYPVVEANRKQYAGTTFYYPKEEGTPLWYDAFPSVLFKENFNFMEPIGETVEEGFRIRDK